MKAPSEKHLEDWIVDNPLGFGDPQQTEFVPEEYRPLPRIEGSDGRYIAPFFKRLIARQIRLPAGIPDLIYSSSRSIHVVEIKKGPITSETVAQTLRYMHELKEIFYWVVNDCHDFTPEQWAEHKYLPMFDLEMTEYPQQEICGMVVGSHMEDNSLSVVCAAAGIAVVTYDLLDDWYWFAREPVWRKGTADDYREYGYGALGEAMRSMMKNRSTWQKEIDIRDES